MNRRFPHPLRLAPALMVGTCVLVGELALAAIPDSAGVIHACFKQNNGQVRVVEPGTSCHPSEAALSWNANGAPGPGPTIAARIRIQPRFLLNAASRSIGERAIFAKRRVRCDA